MEWLEIHALLWKLRKDLEKGDPLPLGEVLPAKGDTGMAALRVWETHEQDADSAFEEWLQGRGPLCAQGIGATLLDMRLTAAANLARAFDQAHLPVPPGWTERQLLSWLVRELWWSCMLPVLDQAWLQFHGLKEE